MTFAERAKALKDKSRLTLSEIATACNISESMVSRYINGQNIPPEDTARKILDLLNAAAQVAAKHDDDARIDLLAIRTVYEERLDDMRDNIADLKRSLRTEKKEKWIVFSLLSVAVVLIFILFFIDAANGNIGWLRY